MNPVLRFFLILFLLACSSVKAQISGELRSASDSHSSDCSSSRSSSSSSSDDYSSSSSSDDDDDYSYSGSSLLSVPLPFPFVNAQRKTLAKKAGIKRITSIDVIVPAGLSTHQYLTFSPEVRANWGIFSGSFRYYNLIEPKLEGPDSWRTFDIDSLQINVINSKPIRLRMGTGITVEEYKGHTFQEFIGGLDLFLLQDKVIVSNEARISTNYCGCPAQRKEYNAGLNFRLADSRHFAIYNSYNFLIQEYYGQVNVWSVGGGLRFMIK